MHTYVISYFYLATGMEGHADIKPQRVIEAKNKEQAAYVYWVMFGHHLDISFKEFTKLSDSEKYWGLSIRDSEFRDPK